MIGIFTPLRILGARVRSTVARFGFAARFFCFLIRHSGPSFQRLSLTIREIYFNGVLSIVIIAASALFVGMVLSLQTYETLKRFGSGDGVGTVVALSLTRELGPVLAALLFASRAGSAMTSAIGLMKTTEQLSAMEMMAVEPVARVVAPRFWAGVFSMPILASLFNVIGIAGGFLIAVSIIGIDAGTFWSQMQNNVDFNLDIVNGLIKSIVFGITVSFIAVFEGFNAYPTADGVSAATTRTVVVSSLSILILDFVLTAFMYQAN